MVAVGRVATANITPDVSGIDYYDEALFLQTMRIGYVKARKLSSLMPFGEHKNLSDDDLKAIYAVLAELLRFQPAPIYAYLRTLKPVKHRVDNSLPPTYCKLCKQTHGAGDQN